MLKVTNVTLTAAIRRVAVWTQEQRHVVVRGGVADDEVDRDVYVERFAPASAEVAADVERELIVARAGVRALWHQRRHPAVVIGGATKHVDPRLTVPPAQPHGNARGRAADRNVQHVSGNCHPNTLSSRRRVILRCSAAATCSSVAGSLFMRSRSIASISGALRPEAHTMKTWPKRSS